MRANANPQTAASVDEAECCRRLAPAARLFFLRHVGRDAEDLVQEALMVMVEAIRSGAVGDPDQAGGYLHGVCKNVARSAGRKRARRAGLLDRNAAVFSAQVEPAPIVDRGRLWACLNRLAARARAIVLQTFVEDRDGAEIAAALGTTEGNVRVSRHRALTALRTCMTEETRP